MQIAGMNVSDSDIVEMAGICHELNRAYCRMLGDYSQQYWDDAPERQRQSSINGVRFHLENPESRPEDSHSNWMAEKVATGWTYGPEKDDELKTHPCLVPYEELPAPQKIKDILFLSCVRAMEETFRRESGKLQ